MVAEAAFRLYCFNNLFERHILMFVGSQGRGFYLCEQIATVGSSFSLTRRVSVLMKKPINASTSGCCRFATPVPTTISSWRESRDRTIDQPTSKVMNKVAPWRLDRARKSALNSPDRATETLPPR